MTSTLDTIREALQAALLPKRTSIEKDLAELRAEVRQRDQEARAERIESDHELRAELDAKFSLLLSEVQKNGIRAELAAEKNKAQTETYIHRSLTPLAERVAVLEMSLRDLREKVERAS
jgi:nucleosome binding factor SPN SPT16 subunit